MFQLVSSPYVVGIRTKLARANDVRTFRMVTVRSAISRSPNKIGFMIPTMDNKININGNYHEEYCGNLDEIVKRKKSKILKKEKD